MSRILPAASLAALGLCLLPSARAADGDADKPGAGGKKDKAGDALALAKMLVDSFAILDANGDGKLSSDEFPATDFARAIDADRDGFCSKEECERILKTLTDMSAGKKPEENADFAAWAKKRLETDPRFNAEARRSEFVKNFDQDPKDGKIQKKEYVAGDVDKVFRDFDRDKNGALDERELLSLAKDQLADLEKARRRPTRGNFLVLFDMDDDRKVTRDEYVFLRGPSATFVSFDDDGDGVVTYEELIYQNTSKDRRYRGKDGGKDGPAAAAPPPEKHDVWDLYDKDKDGRVTPEEFAGGETVFRRLDRNRDGSLTAADL